MLPSIRLRTAAIRRRFSGRVARRQTMTRHRLSRRGAAGRRRRNANDDAGLDVDIVVDVDLITSEGAASSRPTPSHVAAPRSSSGRDTANKLRFDDCISPDGGRQPSTLDRAWFRARTTVAAVAAHDLTKREMAARNARVAGWLAATSGQTSWLMTAGLTDARRADSPRPPRVGAGAARCAPIASCAPPQTRSIVEILSTATGSRSTDGWPPDSDAFCCLLLASLPTSFGSVCVGSIYALTYVTPRTTPSDDVLERRGRRTDVERHPSTPPPLPLRAKSQ
ncbi:uncharacterized protein PSFLO_06092 [Pseudozyma flocculosa]|uniref:Uncharacterized protein n=1 Tax=Pseudozyma flocculosa TaxID=84751 RepID=A0A5C3F8N3_9BASI|nr:uncharacterized protein PSFLO_06092 [Pseudozyma flocculosa]